MRSIAEILYDVKVKRAVKKVLAFQGQPTIRHNVGVLYDELYGRQGILPSKTTNAIPEWVISSKGIASLHRLGYDLCHSCSGDGWDATSGGSLFICDKCNGTGITPLPESE